MPSQITKLTPNLIVSNVERSAAFYRDVLGVTMQMTVPDAPPYAFAMMTSGPVEVFLNAPEAAFEEYPAFKTMPIGGTLTLFIEVTGIEESWAGLKDVATVALPLETKWYGMTEFAIADPDGYLITFAERKEAPGPPGEVT
jgi:catechol 2,3-dioxygenase-like lactoylglutathione lyase family enzyme